MLARQEAFVAEAVGRQAGQAQRVVEYGGRAGAQVTGRPRSMARRTIASPGSLMVGMPASDTTKHGGALFDLVEQAVGLVAFVVVVVGDDA